MRTDGKIYFLLTKSLLLPLIKRFAKTIFFLLF